MAASAVAPAPAEREKDLQLLPSTTSGTGSIESAAFQYAQLQSERLRIFAVLGFAAVFIGVTIVRVFGFFEWENDQGEQFGVQRVEEVIRLSRDLGAQDIIAKLYEAVAKFSNGTPQQDDLTAVIIKRL